MGVERNMAKRNKRSGQCPIEQMNIGDVRRLAGALGIPTVELLNASISLSENILNRNAERICEFPQLRYADVSFTM